MSAHKKIVFDVTPTPASYLFMLHMIIDNGNKLTDRLWARKQRNEMLKAGLITKSGETYLAIRGAEWE